MPVTDPEGAISALVAPLVASKEAKRYIFFRFASTMGLFLCGLRAIRLVMVVIAPTLVVLAVVVLLVVGLGCCCCFVSVFSGVFGIFVVFGADFTPYRQMPVIAPLHALFLSTCWHFGEIYTSISLSRRRDHISYGLKKPEDLHVYYLRCAKNMQSH